MNKLEYYNQKLEDLIARRNAYARKSNYLVLSAIDEDIAEVKRRIEDAEPKPITQLISPKQLKESGLVAAVIEVHLAADYLTDCAYVAKEITRKLGGVPVSVVPEIEEIIAKADKFCSYMCGKGEELSSMLLDNETLIEALHKKTRAYVMQRLKPQKTS